MWVLSDGQKVEGYLREFGWLNADQVDSVVRFPGGVSGNVWRVNSKGGSCVLKQPLRRLATREEWMSDPRRLNVEVAALRCVNSWFPEVVPTVIRHDPVNHVCLMSCATDDAVSWKSRMMGGLFDKATASAAGNLLRDIHHESAEGQPSVRPEFDDLEFFEQLRIEPFHRFLIEKYPRLAEPIGTLILELTDHRTALVHGDFSPKNILVRPTGGLILLDFEVAHWGNPVFDLAYCLGHLMLKAWAVGPASQGLACIEAYLDAYGQTADRLLPHLGLMLLARLDGKSTVDYVDDPELRARIRQLAVEWICSLGNPEPLVAISEAFVGLD